MASGIEVKGPPVAASSRVLTREALALVEALHRKFDARRQELLQRRAARQKDFDARKIPEFLAETRSVREGGWQVASCPDDLQKRFVEITGPVERKMMINALNSGASAFMADFEDSLSPTWENVVAGQANLMDAVRRELAFTSPEGKEYRLDERTATLMVRPRGWHLVERHALAVGKGEQRRQNLPFGFGQKQLGHLRNEQVQGGFVVGRRMDGKAVALGGGCHQLVEARQVRGRGGAHRHPLAFAQADIVACFLVHASQQRLRGEAHVQQGGRARLHRMGAGAQAEVAQLGGQGRRVRQVRLQLQQQGTAPPGQRSERADQRAAEFRVLPVYQRSLRHIGQ